MSMSNRMRDRLRKLYRLVLVQMNNIEAAIALPSLLRNATGTQKLYAGHRMEPLESRTLLSASFVGDFDPTQGDSGSGQAPLVVEVSDDDIDPLSDSNTLFDVQVAGTTLVSIGSNFESGNGYSGTPSISGDGRYVVFLSSASNLVDDDTNNMVDIFMFDRDTGEIERISLTEDGNESNGVSYDPFISSNGRYITFTSEATNLVAGDTNGVGDIFVYDRQTEELERVSLAYNGDEGNNHSGVSSISDDGVYVAYASDATNLIEGDFNATTDIFVYNRQTQEVEYISIDSVGTPGNGESSVPVISGDGRYVVYASDATNLVADDTNGSTDIFLFDRQTSETIRISVNSEGEEGNFDSYQPSISGDGRYVAFTSDADNLVDDDTNEYIDIFVYDLQTGAVERVSVSSEGTQGNGDSDTPAISADGRYVVFESDATNLVADDTNNVWDVFVYDRQTGLIERINLGVDDEQATGGDSGDAVISDDGSYVSYVTQAANLVPDDTNGNYDVLLVELDDAEGEPEIEVSGNDNAIYDEDANPSFDTGTDFGSIFIDSETASRSFTVYNTGSAALTISDVTVPEGFTIIESLPESIEAGESATFTVRLDADVLGTKTGDITITTNDTDEETFNFSITGVVELPGEVELTNLAATIDDSRVVTAVVAGSSTKMKLPITVVNQSEVKVAANTRIDIQVYARPVEEGEDILLTTLTSQNISNLKAGASKKFNASFTLPAEIASDDYVLVAVIDSQDVVEESDEDDNEAVGETTITIAEPFVNLTTTLDDSRIATAILAGSATNMKLPITVVNEGNVALASNTRINIQVYARPVDDGEDILLTTLTDQNVSNLKAGASKKFNATFTLPAEIATGDYVLVAVVDTQDVVEESDEEDNEAEGARTIAIAEGFVNLTTTLDDSRVSTSIVAGTPTRMTLPITVVNQGNIALGSDTRIDIQVYARPVEGGDDILLTTLTDQNVSNLKAGASKKFNASFTLPAEIATDDYVLVANIDAQDTVEESDELDNEAEGTSTIAIAEGYVNLTTSVYDSRIPTSIVAGTATRMTLQISVCNTGNIALASGTRIDIQVYARSVEGGDDILITTLTNQNVSNLGPNSGVCINASFTLPADIESDDYVLVANVDSQNVVDESDEEDNEAEGERTISIAEGFVNLTTTLDDSNIPESIEAGSSSRIILPITVVNDGNIAVASNTRIAIQVYARPVEGGDDILLATLTDQSIANLKAGASKRFKASFTLHEEIDSDDYVFVAVVDTLDAVEESNEGDNLAVGTNSIYIAEDFQNNE